VATWSPFVSSRLCNLLIAYIRGALRLAFIAAGDFFGFTGWIFFFAGAIRTLFDLDIVRL
jgi:hypothetical protein